MARKQFDEAPAFAPPAAGWRLIVRRRFQTTHKIYNVGCEVTVEDLGANYRAFLTSHFVEWTPPGVRITARPIDRPPPPPAPKPKPRVEIITVGDDAVASWRATRARMVALCDGNRAIAEDYLLADQIASELYLRATRVHCKAEAKRRNVRSVSPSEAAL